MADEVFDIDRNSIYPSIIKPVYARGNGKSQMQLQLYDTILKGEINMGAGANAWKTFLEKNRVKIGVDLASDEICDATVKGENEMGSKGIIDMDKTFEELLAKPKEEYVWIKGFKGTDKDMRCQDDYQYELGKQFDLDEDVEPEVCHTGFHFCKKLENVFRHYKIGDGNRFFEVEALVRKSDLEPKQEADVCTITGHWSYPTYFIKEDKYAAKSIRFIRELTVDEVFDVFYDTNIRGWNEAQKKRAMETSIRAVKDGIREEALVSAGYSPAFAKYIATDMGRYKTAMAMASLPDVSMDVKVMAIFMDNQEVNMEVI